jgi:hypothetical protein
MTGDDAVFVIERSAEATAPVTATLAVEELEQLPTATVTPRVIGVDVEALKVMDEVPFPLVIVPLVIDHEYVAAPAGVATDATLPVELTLTLAGAVIVEFGTEVMETVCAAEAEQPLPSVTETVYEVVAVGVTTIVAVVAPVDQRYDVPPLAVSVAGLPAQTAVGPLIAAAGGEFTVIDLDAVF